MSKSQHIDETIKDRILRYDMRELLRRLRPDIHVPERGNICSPFRPDTNPSFSMKEYPNGIYFWKDHGTGSRGDNIELYVRLHPGVQYFEAVDDLAHLMFGISAFEEEGLTVSRVVPVVAPLPSPVVKEHVDVLQIMEDNPVLNAPKELVSYWRSRGITDEVMVRLGCRYVVYRNNNQVGKPVYDSESGIPLLDTDGNQVLSDGLYHAVGLPNDIGAFSMRTADTAVGKGYKNSNRSFITTLLANCGRPCKALELFGKGDGLVSEPWYSSEEWRLYINPLQWFYPVAHSAAKFAMTFISSFLNRTLSADDCLRVGAVLSELNMPVDAPAVIVEGMFDGLSIGEIDRMRGRLGKERDIVVLNGVGNVRWAVPFLCRHQSIQLMLDNDMSSKAGQLTSRNLRSLISDFCETMGLSPSVVDVSGSLSGHKDVNEWLVSAKHDHKHHFGPGH